MQSGSVTAFMGTTKCRTYVPDNNFEAYLETHDATGNVVNVGDANSMGDGIANNDYVYTDKISLVTNLDLGLKILHPSNRD